MRRPHFTAFAPQCPHCLSPLLLTSVTAETGDDVLVATLVCAAPACRAEFPVIDGVPIVLADLRRLLSERAIELLLREDLPAEAISLIGDALGPDTWFDVVRQTVSTYAWDAYADLDPAEAVGGTPGAARRCLQALLRLMPEEPPTEARLLLDLGCGAGRTTSDLAQAAPSALVLGIDKDLALLRLARGARGGMVRYGRRRVGLVYDERWFRAELPGAERIDFWACDAAALPFAPGRMDMVLALNLLDCVPDPVGFLHTTCAQLRPGGTLLLATPFDWAGRATAPVGWIGGHSQRGPGAGAAEPLLAALLSEGSHDRAVPGMTIAGTGEADWHTRLHDRAIVRYTTHLVAAQRRTPVLDSAPPAS